MRDLSQVGVYLGDIKGDNILVKHTFIENENKMEFKLKLTDPGIAIITEEQSLTHYGKACTSNYFDERFLKIKKANRIIDIQLIEECEIYTLGRTI